MITCVEIEPSLAHARSSRLDLHVFNQRMVCMACRTLASSVVWTVCIKISYVTSQCRLRRRPEEKRGSNTIVSGEEPVATILGEPAVETMVMIEMKVVVGIAVGIEVMQWGSSHVVDVAADKSRLPLRTMVSRTWGEYFKLN